MEQQTKIDNLLENMTLEEKVSLLSGANFWNTKAVERLDLPSMLLTDGPHGLRKQGGKADHLGLNKSKPATCFPTAATVANSWDESLLHKMGVLLGEEAHSEEVSVLLGPGLNIKRNPLCGRNFEYFSEDPYLSGKLASSMIQGIQESGISACPKHFAVNSQEHLRMSIDEIVDERALRELYLEGFRIAVEEGKPQTIMTSYNRVNGDYTNENLHLLQDILQDEWGYNGLIVTDWGGNNDRVKGLIAGNNLEMPYSGGMTDQDVLQAVQNNELSEEVLNERLRPLLNTVLSTKQSLQNSTTVDYDFHHQQAVDIAAQSMVLLKNNDHILPLDATKKIAVIGDFAKHPRFQGAGSSLINPTKVSDALSELTNMGISITGYSKGFQRYGGSSRRLTKQAVKLAQSSEIVLLFLGLDESSEAEGLDREHMSLPQNQLDLMQELASVHDNIVIVLAGGSPVEIPFKNKAKAILHSYLGGQGTGEAVAKILCGQINPSGKLAETYPNQLADVLSSKYYPGKEATAEHREGIFVGYRYFDTANIDVSFPFGYGLSYSTFEYSDLDVQSDSVSFKIKNTSDIAGYEIAQLYVSHSNSSIYRAKQELKGFQKVFLKPEEETTITFNLSQDAFKYFDVYSNKWSVEGGTYKISIGASSRDIKLTTTINIEGHKIHKEQLTLKQKIETALSTNDISDDVFMIMIGREIPSTTWDRESPLSQGDVIAQAKYKSLFGKLFFGLFSVVQKFLFWIKKPIRAIDIYFIMNMPFRSIPRFTKGSIKPKTVNRILRWINGRSKH